jgi:hypothetical protein
MKLPRLSKVGLALVGIGILIFLAIAFWLKSIRSVVLDVPMPSSTTPTRQDFSVDLDGTYLLKVAFDRATAPSVANCLLGGKQPESTEDPDCAKTQPQLKFEWELELDGQTRASGSSERRGSWLVNGRNLRVTIVGFPAQQKRHYSLTIKRDGVPSSVEAPPSRVEIEIGPSMREELLFAGLEFDSVAFLLCAVGCIMFLVSFLRAKIRNSPAQ